MSEELVSVCIPAYNSGRFIVRTIESILNQTYKNIEIVVVDDCSSDDTVDKVKSIKDDRIKLIVNEANLGMSRNWDKCVRSCSGRYVKLIPADDCIYPDCISRSVIILEKHPEVSLVVVGTDLVDNDDKITGSYMHWPGNGIVKGARIAKTSVMLNNSGRIRCVPCFAKTTILQQAVLMMIYRIYLILTCGSDCQGSAIRRSSRIN